MIPASSASSGVWWCRSAETSSASVMVPKAARDRVEQTVGAVRDGRGDEALESHLSVGAICAGCCLCSSTATAARAGAGGYPCLCGQVPPRTSPTSAASSRRAISGKPGPWRQRNRGHSDSSTENGHLPCANASRCSTTGRSDGILTTLREREAWRRQLVQLRKYRGRRRRFPCGGPDCIQQTHSDALQTWARTPSSGRGTSARSSASTSRRA